MFGLQSTYYIIIKHLACGVQWSEHQNYNEKSVILTPAVSNYETPPPPPQPYMAFFQDHAGELVPEESFFWTLWC